VTVTITGMGLTQSMFEALSQSPPGDTQGYFAASYLNQPGVNGGRTGVVGSTTGDVRAVPEPATIVALATGLPIGLLVLRRRLRVIPATV
jgi:hypothetical protein